MFGHRPSRRGFLQGLLSTVCAWPFVRRTATSGAGPVPYAPVADAIERAQASSVCAYDGSDRILSVMTFVYDSTPRLFTDLPRVTSIAYDGLGRRSPDEPA